MANKRLDSVREPKQQRSKDRSEKILEAAKALIAENGCAKLKMRGIAERAGITPGSIYQYYRNKAEIIHALGEYYLDLTNSQLSQSITAPITSREELTELLQRSLESFYTLYRDDPVIRDIWMGTVTDKTMQNLDRKDTLRNLNMYFDIARPLFPKKSHAELKRALLLLIQFSNAGIRVAIEENKKEGGRLFETTKQLLLLSWKAFMQLHAES